MSTSSENDSEVTSTQPDALSPIVLLIKDIADTTWRMFVPTIGLLLLGFYVDRSLETQPWLTILGAVCGIGITTLLIKQQLTKVKQK